MGISGLDHGRLDEIALGIVIIAAKYEVGFIGFLGIIDIFNDAVKGALINHGIDKNAEILHITHLGLIIELEHDLFDLGPE